VEFLTGGDEEAEQLGQHGYNMYLDPDPVYTTATHPDTLVMSAALQSQFEGIR